MKKDFVDGLGEWGRMRLEHLMRESPKICQMMEENGTLADYLQSYQESFEERAEIITERLREERGVTMELLRRDPFEWVLRDCDVMASVHEILRGEIQR